MLLILFWREETNFYLPAFWQCTIFSYTASAFSITALRDWIIWKGNTQTRGYTWQPNIGLHTCRGALLYKQAEVLGRNALSSDFPRLSPNVCVQNEKSCLPCHGSNRLGVLCFIVRLVQHWIWNLSQYWMEFQCEKLQINMCTHLICVLNYIFSHSF